jgi:hypothetical protein
LTIQAYAETGTGRAPTGPTKSFPIEHVAGMWPVQLVAAGSKAARFYSMYLRAVEETNEGAPHQRCVWQRPGELVAAEAYSHEKVASRDIRVRHGATENGP